MKKNLFLWLLGLFSACSILTAADKPPELTVTTEITRYFPATKCYAGLVLTESGETWQRTRTQAAAKVKALSETVKKQFPQAEMRVITVNVGRRDQQPDGMPTVEQILLFTLPPDEDTAVRLLDAGRQAGMRPLDSDGFLAVRGAVGCGIGDPELEAIRAKMLPDILRQAEKEAGKLAAFQGKEVVRLKSFRIGPMKKADLQIRYRNLQIDLPCRVWSQSPDRVPVTLAILADFQLRDRRTAPENEAKDAPQVTVRADVQHFAAATACHVLFQLTETGETLQSARQKLTDRLRRFTEDAVRQFPAAKPEVLFSVIGASPASAFRETAAPPPTITHVLMFTLPPDPRAAVQLLDMGKANGIAPFCARTYRHGNGAVFYSIADLEAAVDRLYPEAVRQLLQDAGKAAPAAGGKLGNWQELTRFFYSPSPIEAECDNLKIPLPVPACATDPNRIPVTLTLSARFAVAPADATTR